MPRLVDSSEPISETRPLPGPPLGLEKISACLIDLILPSLPEDAGIREWRAGIALAALAWNLASLTGSDAALEVENLIQDVEAEAQDDFPFLEDLIHQLVARKLQLYANDPRLVLSWDVRKAGGGRVHIVVEATLPVVAIEERLAAGYRAEAATEGS